MSNTPAWKKMEGKVGSTDMDDIVALVDERATAGTHPNLAAHDALGLATDAELTTHANAPDPHVLYALDADLANHEADTTNIHGFANTANVVLTNDARLSDARTPTSHAISGAAHTGTLDHTALSGVSADQHHAQFHAAVHATGQPDALSASAIGAAASTHAHAESDVTSLTADLAARLLTSEHTVPINATDDYRVQNDVLLPGNAELFFTAPIDTLLSGPFAPDRLYIPNGHYRLHYSELQLNGSNEATVDGSGELVLFDFGPRELVVA